MSTERSESRLRLALPKGRMQAGVLRLLADAGIAVHAPERGYRPTISLPGVDTKILKPQNIIEMLDLRAIHEAVIDLDPYAVVHQHFDDKSILQININPSVSEAEVRQAEKLSHAGR